MFLEEIEEEVKMERWIVTGILMISSYNDLKWKAVPSWLFAVSGMGGFFYALIENRGKAYWIFWAGSSVTILIVCRITKQQIGYGDGLMWGIMSLYLKIWENIKIWMIAFILALLFSGISFLLGKIDKKTEIPFLPFLTVAYLLG